MKVLAYDPQREAQRAHDRSDVFALLRDATQRHIDDARAAVRLISERGFDREKNLLEELEEFVRKGWEPNRS